MAIFSLLAKLGLDGTAFESGLKRSQSVAKGVGREISTTLGSIFTVDKLSEYGMKAIETAGRLQDLSTQLGVSAEFLQQMKFAAEMGGSSLDDVSSSLEKITIARQKALSGDAGIVKAFEQLGVSASDLRSAKLEDIFMTIGRAFEGDANPQKLIGPLREIAGKSAGALIPAMAEGLSSAADQAARLGLIMSDSVVSTLDEANDRVDVMKKTLESGMGSAIANLMEPLFRQLDAIGASIQTFGMMVFGGKQISGKSPLDNLKYLFSQSAQAYTAALDEMDAETEARAEGRKKRAEIRAKTAFETDSSKFKMVAVSAASSDALARTGGFTGYQANLDKYFGAVRSQTDDLKDIARNTKRTADAVQD